jgi:hypothetical protein
MLLFIACLWFVFPYVHIAVKIDYLEVRSKPLSSIDMYPTAVHNNIRLPPNVKHDFNIKFKCLHLQMSNTIAMFKSLQDCADINFC